jgi:hypothetical protein
MSILTLSTRIAHSIMLLSPITITGLLFSPSSSIAGREIAPEVVHRNCAQLQRTMNNRNNPDYEYKGFEKVKMRRQTITIAGRYVVTCNGGTIIDRTDGTICNGYIAYAYTPTEGLADFYADWGRAYDGIAGNLNNTTGQEKYCRWIDRPR